MGRYTRIQSIIFGQTPLPLPLSVRLSRRAEALSAGGDDDAFATSVQIGRPVVLADVRIRGTATAEELSLGQIETLSFTVAPAESGQSARQITLAQAVLVAIELIYEQATMTVARLQFVAEAQVGTTDPFSAEAEE